ncbi:penicillin-binding transpeptidase domain-containing protein [Luteolibacter arcticus]|uniref:Beta-lactamase n=1 Tax=Luteolibacter arcticus TaxID=1581411 RepID=A0ABT3GCP7_9BACT|nr:penicillin-binding transpeptidase domain-containing protein [Luteolibacter arcticus]MCW1921389.1 penicillin-binding transpeptidase domain-containing protein [Luteolibacter arcticus]
MEPRYRLRVYLLTALVLFGFGVLLSRLYEFQIDKRDFYRNQVPGNRQITVREPGIRGTIKDRNGIELARNKRQYEISFNLEEIHGAYRLQRAEDPTIEREQSEKGMPRVGPETDIVEIVKARVIQPLTDLGLERDFNAEKLRTHYKTHGGLVPFVYTRDITYEDFAKFAEHSLDIPGVYLNVRPLREYPYKALSCHTLGYLRQWATGDIPEDARRQYGYQYVGDDKGVAGVEATLDDILRGSEGWKQVVKSEKGKILGETLVDAVDPGIGAEVTLTIDAEVQYLLSNILRRAGTASGVVMDVETGEILAMASVPDYNPNDFIPSISKEKNAEYETAKIKPLIDRAISRFPPGSTFKVPTALVGATKGFATKSYSCSGYLSYGSAKVGCWIAQKGGSHGGLTLPKAIQQSCNPYFMQLAGSIGAKGMADGFAMLGLGEKTGIPLPNESPGLVTGSRTWQRERPNAKVTPIDMGFLSIGQGNALATPLQLCAVVSCVANGGRYYHPRLVKRAIAHKGTENEEVIKDEPRLKVDLLKEGMKASDLNLIREGMRMAVNVPGGTAGRAKIPGYEVAAKTGTAQVSKVLDLHNAWTIAFAPYDKPKYAVCMLVENGKSGGAVCGPLVHLLFRGLMARDEGMRLPLHPLEPVVGNLDPIKEIALPEDVLAAIDVSQDDGETGNEGTDAATAAGIPTEPLPDSQTVTPKPTITPEADDEGRVTKPRKAPPRNR